MRRSDEADLRLVRRQFKGHPHGDRIARGLQHVLETLPAAERLRFLHEAILQGIHRLMGAHPLRQFQPPVVDVKGNNLLRTQDFRPLQGKNADRAATEDCHGFPAPVPHLQQTVHRHGGRFKHRRLLIRDRRIVFDRVHRRDHHIFRETPLFPAADKAVMLAEGEVPQLAIVALHARHQRRAADRVPDLEVLHPFADFHDIAAELMSQHHRVEMRPVVQHPGNVAPADAGRPDPDLYRSRPHHRRFPVCIPDILIAVQYRRFHFIIAFFRLRLCVHNLFQRRIQFPVSLITFIINSPHFRIRRVGHLHADRPLCRFLEAAVNPGSDPRKDRRA